MTIRLFSRAMLAEPLELTQMRFYGGEAHVRIDDIEEVRDVTNWGGVVIDARIRNGDDVMQMLMLRDAIRHATDYVDTVELFMPYLPYARQDRMCNPGEAFSAKAFAALINAQDFHRVHVCDPHSDVSASLLDRVRVIPQHKIVETAFLTKALTSPAHTDHLLVAPDLGAVKKLKKLPGDHCYLDKTRRPSDGAILGTEIIHGTPLGRDCLIIDDICDGGRTFIEAAKVLRKAGAKSVSLFVTHGIFSKGFEELQQHLDLIVTTDSWFQPVAAGQDVELQSNNFVRVLPVFEQFFV